MTSRIGTCQLAEWELYTSQPRMNVNEYQSLKEKHFENDSSVEAVRRRIQNNLDTFDKVVEEKNSRKMNASSVSVCNHCLIKFSTNVCS